MMKVSAERVDTIRRAFDTFAHENDKARLRAALTPPEQWVVLGGWARRNNLLPTVQDAARVLDELEKLIIAEKRQRDQGVATKTYGRGFVDGLRWVENTLFRVKFYPDDVRDM